MGGGIYEKFSHLSALLFITASLVAASAANADNKKNRKSQQTQDTSEAPILDGSKRDDNRIDKKQEWYRGDLMGLDDD